MILSLHPTAYKTKPVALHGRTSVRRRWCHAHRQVPIRPRRSAETQAPHRIPAGADPPRRPRRSRAILTCDTNPQTKRPALGLVSRHRTSTAPVLADGGSAAATRLGSWVILARAAGVPPIFDAVSAPDP